MELSELKLYGGPGDDTFISGHKLSLLDARRRHRPAHRGSLVREVRRHRLQAATPPDGSFLKELDGSKLELKIAGVESAEFKFLDDVDYKFDAAEWKLSELKLYGGPGDDTFISGHKVSLLDGGAASTCSARSSRSPSSARRLQAGDDRRTARSSRARRY